MLDKIDHVGLGTHKQRKNGKNYKKKFKWVSKTLKAYIFLLFLFLSSSTRQTSSPLTKTFCVLSVAESNHFCWPGDRLEVACNIFWFQVLRGLAADNLLNCRTKVDYLRKHLQPRNIKKEIFIRKGLPQYYAIDENRSNLIFNISRLRCVNINLMKILIRIILTNFHNCITNKSSW